MSLQQVSKNKIQLQPIQEEHQIKQQQQPKQQQKE